MFLLKLFTWNFNNSTHHCIILLSQNIPYESNVTPFFRKQNACMYAEKQNKSSKKRQTEIDRKRCLPKVCQSRAPTVLFQLERHTTSIMASSMHGQMIGPDKSLGTLWAVVGPLARMFPFVSRQFITASELQSARRTRERAFACRGKKHKKR